MRDTSTKASSGWKAVLPGQRSWQIETQGLVALDSTYNIAYLLALITNKTKVHLYWRTANVDDYYYHGYAYLTSVSSDAPNQGNSGYQASFIGDGALTLVTAGTAVTWDPPTEALALAPGGKYSLTTDTVVTTTLPSVSTALGEIIVKNTSTHGSVQVTPIAGTLIDGKSSVYVGPSKYITIIPNVSQWDTVGTYDVTLIT
jgi:predicted secreted protein